MLVYSTGAKYSVCGPMEDVLEVYQLPYDPACPVICMDENQVGDM